MKHHESFHWRPGLDLRRCQSAAVHGEAARTVAQVTLFGEAALDAAGSDHGLQQFQTALGSIFKAASVAAVTDSRVWGLHADYFR